MSLYIWCPILGAECTSLLPDLMHPQSVLFKNSPEMITSKPILFVLTVDLICLPRACASLRELFVSLPPPATVPFSCASPPPPLLTGNSVRQAFTSLLWLLSPPSYLSPVSAPLQHPPTPPPPCLFEAADIFGCQFANSKHKQANEKLTGATL